MSGARVLASLSGAAILLGLAGAGHAQTRADLIPLGRSAVSGAVCEAVRDYDDPVVQAQGRRGWNIHCRGWDVSLGRLYVLPTSAGETAWSQALAQRAACAEPKSETLAGLGAVSRRACHATGSNATYLSYGAKHGQTVFAAEGASQIADVLETGLRVVAGAAKPPQMADVQVSAASAEIASDFGGSAGGLARAQAAAATDPARLRAHAYVQNNEWRFDQAETDFQALAADAQSRNAPPRELGEARLNLALNISNNGRFAEADREFALADAQVARANDPVLAAEAMGYHALHLRNQGKFAEAVQAGRATLQARQQARAAAGVTDKGPTVLAVSTGEVAIGAELSHALNSRPGGGALIGRGGEVSVSDQLLVQDAQAWEVIGSSLAAQGDTAGAREALAQAGRALSASEANGALNVLLQSRVEADFADLDMAAGQPAAAADRLATSILILRARHAGTATEGGLLLQLGRAQMAAGRDDAALASFGRAFALFQSQRGSLGASADAAAPYFDLLLAKIASDPTKADDYRGRFFSAAESVVSNSTAQTVSKLAARVASGDGAITGLVRALDDTKRELRATEARIANAQTQNSYAGEAKTDLDAQLKTLQQQSDTLEAQLLAANPRYAQLVAATASLPELQKALHKDEVYLKIALLGGRGYGVLVSQAAAKPYRFDLSREQAASAVRALRAPFEAEDGLPAFDVVRAYALFQQMAGPVKSEILAAKHLIYEPDGALISLPVGALVTEDPAPLLAGLAPGKDPDYRKVAWLGARLDSSLVLSAPSFMQSRAFSPSRAKQTFLAFADPVSAKAEPRAYASVLKRSGTINGGGGANICEGTRQALLRLPELPDTADEVRKVGASFKNASGEDLLIGKAFTDDAVKTRTDLGDFKVLYFATHGLLPQPSACLPEPALVTSVGASDDSDGLLDASEILDLKLDADLVVLSACDTGGAGSEATDLTGLQGGGEALGGLTRAVIYAGGRALVVSHWSVDSAATVRLMTGLFSAPAVSEAEALQQAQLSLQQSADWSHPYFWAPFTIVGDGARAMPTAGAAGAAAH
ncbi:CHAT domain-containing protein [Phenylobacterium sp.]|uniref:CHAT domain-containing protein n=1 Tax=Phenylobacterium sp. TaxID=1871053 RepID=UPI00122B6A26|nr:CHAT domain-containing protein [Phenylobacterium sp.]THD53060.1 MAG: CHAT domain-containing protein [Phenylobacterium sp.]